MVLHIFYMLIISTCVFRGWGGDGDGGDNKCIFWGRVGCVIGVCLCVFFFFFFFFLGGCFPRKLIGLVSMVSQPLLIEQDTSAILHKSIKLPCTLLI